MCPFCIAALGQVVAGVVSAGGLTALAVKLSRKKDNSNEIPNPHAIERSNQNESSSQDVNQNGR
jgi:hypothetical protein